MSSSESQVSIELDEPIAELKVIDGRYHVIERGVGASQFVLGPGVYKARAAAAGDSVEALFAVTGDGAKVTVRLPPVRFRSALPLDRTSTSHEYHQHALSVVSRQPPRAVGLGAGATLLVSVRDPSSTCFEQRHAPAEARQNYRRSFAGLALNGEALKQPLDLLQVADFDPDLGYLVAHLALAPGSYTLTYEGSGGAPVAMPVLARANFQTQLFFHLDASADLARPGLVDVRDRAVLLAPLSRPFDPLDPVLRQTEIARGAYSQRRFALAKALLEEFVSKHTAAPVLGLLAAQLALHAPNGVDRDQTRPLLNETLDQLTRLLGATFPDVVALRLALHPDSSPEPATEPPLLRASWQILERHREGGQVAPELSELLSRAATVGTWLCWRPAPALTSNTLQALLQSDTDTHDAVFLDGTRHPAPLELLSSAHTSSALFDLGRTVKGLQRGAKELSTWFDIPPAGPAAREPELLLALIQQVTKAPWWHAAFEWLEQHGEDSALAGSLSGLQATLLASLKLASDRAAHGLAFDAEDLEVLLRGLQVSSDVLWRSLSQLQALILQTWPDALARRAHE
jgi:hypothetical protein